MGHDSLIRIFKMSFNIIYLFIFVFSINVCDGKKYNNYTLYRGIPVNQSHLEFFSNLDETYDVNFWRDPGLLYRAIDFIINPADQPLFLADAERQGVYLTTIIKNVQRAFDQQTVKTYIRRRMDSFDWRSYFRLNDIYHWLKDLSRKYPDEVTLQSIGTSIENRDIMSVKVKLNGGKPNRTTIIVEGGIHAREWIAPAVVTYLINEIVHSETSGNEVLKEIAKNYEWYFVPVLNVDGYEFTHTEDRLWRKNRNGEGVDLNRNFGHAFGTTGVSWKKKTDLYCGPKPFSEKETKAMSEFIQSKSENLKYYIAFHSYGQYMILPYANSQKHLDNFDEMYDVCKRVSAKISERYNTKYVIGTAYDTVGYMSSGVSGCWVKGTFKVPYVVTFELRDNGYDGFALPPSMILPTCKETMDGLLVLFDYDKKKLTLESKVNGVCKISEKIIVANIFLLFILVFCP